MTLISDNSMLLNKQKFMLKNTFWVKMHIEGDFLMVLAHKIVKAKSITGWLILPRLVYAIGESSSYRLFVCYLMGLVRVFCCFFGDVYFFAAFRA